MKKRQHREYKKYIVYGIITVLLLLFFIYAFKNTFKDRPIVQLYDISPMPTPTVIKIVEDCSSNNYIKQHIASTYSYEGEQPKTLTLNTDGTFSLTGYVAKDGVSHGEWEFSEDSNSITFIFIENINYWTQVFSEENYESFSEYESAIIRFIYDPYPGMELKLEKPRSRKENTCEIAINFLNNIFYAETPR